MSFLLNPSLSVVCVSVRHASLSVLHCNYLVSVFSTLTDYEILEIRIIDWFSLIFFLRARATLACCSQLLLNEHWLCEHLEGRDEGFIIIVHFPWCIWQGWAYSRPCIEYMKLAGISFCFEAEICTLTFSDAFCELLTEVSPSGEPQKDTLFIHHRGKGKKISMAILFMAFRGQSK